jgi:hypothetical protein
MSQPMYRCDDGMYHHQSRRVTTLFLHTTISLLEDKTNVTSIL